MRPRTFLRHFTSMTASDFLGLLLHDFRKPCGSQPFIILFSARTGSNMLASMLDSHPEVVCHHEIFKHARPHVAMCARVDGVALGAELLADKQKGWRFVLKTLTNPERFRALNGKAGVKALGFKINPTVDKAQILPLLLNHSLKKVVLERADYLAAFTSLTKAEQDGTWVHLARPPKPAPKADTTPQKVRLEPRKLRYFLRKRRSVARIIRMVLKISGQRAFFWITASSTTKKQSARCSNSLALHPTYA